MLNVSFVLLFSGKHLQYIRAHPFDDHIPNDFHQEFPNATNGTRLDPNALNTLPQDLTSDGGEKFKSFVKRILKAKTAKTAKKIKMDINFIMDEEDEKDAKGEISAYLFTQQKKSHMCFSGIKRTMRMNIGRKVWCECVNLFSIIWTGLMY